MIPYSKDEQYVYANRIISFFEKYPIIIQPHSTPQKVNFIHSDTIYEYNFRVIDSIMPEILFSIALKSNNRSLNKTISALRKDNLGFNVVDQYLFLKAKFCHLFEVVLSSNFSKEVWTGKWFNNLYNDRSII